MKLEQRQKTPAGDTNTLVEVTIYDCAQHTWMQGGVTGDSLMKALANFAPTSYRTHPNITISHGGTTTGWHVRTEGKAANGTTTYSITAAHNTPEFYWHGWVIRIHGDDGTTVVAGPQIYRRLTFVGTHNPAWVDHMRGTQATLRSLLQSTQREGGYSMTTLIGKASALRDQVNDALEPYLEPTPA
jgi:hypothetical protein